MRCSTTEPGIAVVGAGIAGLTFAAWRGRAGIDVTVYEQATALGQVGAGIQLSPNAVRPLHRLGLAEALAAVAVVPEAVELRGWRDGRLLSRTVLGAECAARYGAPYYTLHRADLHRCLVGAAEAAGAGIRLGHRCVGLTETADSVGVDFADGSSAAAGLVVGADGIRSVVRAGLTPDRPRYSGTTVYRGLIPADRLPGLGPPRVQVWLGPEQHCVWYPVRGGQWVSFTAAIRDAAPPGPDDWRTESWRSPGEPADLVRAFRGWHGEVRDVLGAADAVTRWALFDRAPLDRWHSPRSTVIGDAAHPLLPFGAQGANQAIEAAVTLASRLSHGTRGGGDAVDALRAYQRIRVCRLAAVRAAVARNTDDHHLADGPGQAERDRALAAGTGLTGSDWLYAYDAEAGR